MRVLLVSGYAHLPDLRGGLQTTTHELALTLVEHGHAVAVLAGLGTDALGRTPAPRSDDRLGYLTARVPEPEAALASMAAVFQPDAVVVQTSPRTVPLLVAALELGLPSALYLHNVEVGVLAGSLLPDPAILYLANSAFTAARYRALYGIAAEVLTPLVRPELYRVPHIGGRVLYINPTAIKGAEIFIALAGQRPAVPFTVVPSWQLPPAWLDWFRERTRELANVQWREPVDDMRPLLADTRVLLMPSLWEETFGRSVVEAQLNGIPVLASDRGNLPDTVGEGGLLVPAHAPIERWAEALDRLWGAEWQRHSTAARAHAERPEHAPDALAHRLIDLLAAHIAHNPSPPR